uniref:Mov10 RISC complex RNA helicase n=1 Tax=Mus musculus TaxID=10090 RepID=D3YYR1_MOUSE
MSGALPFALQLFYVPRLWRVGVGVALAEAPRSSGLFRGPQAISTFGSWLAARGGSSGPANSKPRRRLSVSFPRTLLPGPQPPPPRCLASSAAESSGRPARGSRVFWPNVDWTWRQIVSGCGRFTTTTSSPAMGPLPLASPPCCME